MRKKIEKRLTYAVIVETVLLLAAGVTVLGYLTVILAPVLFEPVPRGSGDMTIHAYPDKLYYIAGKDTALELSGGSFCFDIVELDNEGFACVQIYKDPDYHDTVPMAECDFHSDIDFMTEGRYYVYFNEHVGERQLTCAFPVDVIAPAEQGGEEK